ncbi:branched-chain amino acid ABC transporter ATP-binding protein/permease [Herbaspirillum sp. RTI4]|uniref:branched-chain amino acid ABC transporter ATP-binding protein/permease n=1 Tax=Herbaspirillum sp. RTI4 TaxID=3048640 RepID=UPI002AB57153|nr:branched-chain amino acid ABC transporter ATP-binding protein/permease [Herbaspirillum sp. RTI4]MDY7578130.1 branched-chain amino acid ABC transporter ATP-binding protein/permease [Herbaspirillum sp. RTI4]MEA9980719.1 branched-chain amino acid ABC transporter ATP-binding protein/permease [Herbaspirillum sp. RTI4]
MKKNTLLSAALAALPVAVFLLVLLLPLLPVPAFWITLLSYVGLYSIVTLGLVLLTGVAGLTSFGQAAFVGIGAYATAYLTTQYDLSPWLSLLAGLLITGVSALLIGAFTMRLSGHYLPLSTIAWGLSLYYLFGNLDSLGKYDGIGGIPSIALFGFEFNSVRSMYFLIWCAVILSLVSVKNFLNSRPGRAVRALKSGYVMPESMGVNTPWMKIVIFVYAAMLASVSGWLYAHLQHAVNPTPFGLKYGIDYLLMAVVGGAGFVWGALLGAGVITVLGYFLQEYLPGLLGSGGNFDMIVFGVLLVLFLQYANEGLWPFIQMRFPGKPPALAPDDAPPLLQKTKPEKGEIILELVAARKQFGGLVAVNDVSFSVKAGEIVGLIGPNGAGKSTTFNLVTGVLPASGGKIHYRQQSIAGLSSRQIVRRGLARTFQHVRLVAGMSVLENVAIGAHLRGDHAAQGGVLASIFRCNREEERKILFEARRQLERVGLGDLLYRPAGSLALGQQRIVEIARALCCDPALLLLDEPAAGLRYQEKQALSDLLKKLRGEGMAVLLVEHDMDFVMQLTDHIVVMEFGAKIAEGSPAQIQVHPAVLEAYLGGVE